MHGRPRVKDKTQVDPAKVKAAEQKASLFGTLLENVLTARHSRLYDAPSLQLSAKLLELNPEIYTAWNYRREAYQGTIAAGGEEAVALITKELVLTQKSLMRNPKSYATWHHRRWAITYGYSSLEHEITLVEKLLDADERNFHGWGYRRFIAQRMGMPIERELQYTKKKIEQNFSNYSAWHYRTLLLPLLHTHHESGFESIETPTHIDAGSLTTSSISYEVLSNEFTFVQQALYTEPSDQSGWFYHRWLLGCAFAKHKAGCSTLAATENTGYDVSTVNIHTAMNSPSEEREKLNEILSQERAMCEELLEVEVDAKWPLLTLTRIIELQKQLRDGEEMSAGDDDVDEEILQLYYKKLVDVDCIRKGYYMDVQSANAAV